MKASIAFPLILAGVLCGCAHEQFSRGRGDVGQFIVQQAVARCGLTVSTNGLPPVGGRWRYSEDDHGVIVHLPREQYPAVESLLRQTFGEPTLGPGDTKDGGKLGGYRLTPKGGGIQFGYDAKRTHVIIIRPLTKQEFGEGIMKAMQEDKFWENLRK